MIELDNFEFWEVFMIIWVQMEAKYERSRTFLLKLIVIKSDNPDFEKFRQKLRDKLLQIRLKSIEETFYPFQIPIW